MLEEVELDVSCYGRESGSHLVPILLYKWEGIIIVLHLEDYTQIVNYPVTRVPTSNFRCNATVRLPILTLRLDSES